MATRDTYLLLFKDKHNGNGQYNNFTLKKDHQMSSDAFFGRSKSVITENRNVLDYDFTNDSQTKTESHLWKKSTKNLSSCAVNHVSGKEDRLKKEKALSASTFSLYIEVYENSSEANSFDATKEGLKMNGLIKNGFNAKQIDFDSTLVIQNVFEFSRQQENGEAITLEIPQYRASQRLFNPNLQTHQAPVHQSLKEMPLIDELGNKIEIRDQIAIGNFGRIFNGILNDQHEVVVKKQIRCEAVYDEWKYLSTFKSKYIIEGILVLYRENDTMYIVMEKADTDLFEYINQIGPVIDAKMFAIIAHQIISGVKAIHDKGVIHRDIKLTNILVRGRNLKICDFGMSIESNRILTSKNGTASTMAPEVIMKSEYGNPIDIWSLGCVLHYIRLSAYPFNTDGDNVEIPLLDMITKIQFDGLMEEKVRKFFRYRTLHFAKKTVLFENSPIYYRQQQLILNCLNSDPCKRSTADDLLKMVMFKDLSDADFLKMPLFNRE